MVSKDSNNPKSLMGLTFQAFSKIDYPQGDLQSAQHNRKAALSWSSNLTIQI